MPVDSDSLGAYLRQERERRQLSLQEIAATTKIQLKFLEALENDAYDQLPAPPFVVGFLRAYAQQIALDPEMVLTAYRALQHTPESGEDGPIPVEVSVPKARRLPPVRWAALMLILALGLGLVIHEWRRGRQSESPVASFPAPLQPTLDSARKPAGPEMQSTAQTARSVPVTTSVPPPAASPPPTPQDGEPLSDTPAADTAQTAPLASVAAETPTPQSDTGPPAAQISLLVLQAKALEDTWLRIEIDGQKPFALLLNAGKSLQWEAHERFRLTIGNAHGTRLTLNGQNITLTTGRSNVIRNLLLTRANLQ